MMNELGLVGRLGAPWLAAALWLGSLGCTGGGDDGRGMGGEGGSAAMGGSGGGGQGGDEGMGGEGGASTQRTALETCEAWCRNEARGPSCCVQDPFFGGDCLEGCYDRCENTVAATACVEEWAAARECQLELACDDFFLECEPLNIRFNGCEARINAERNGSCTAAAEGCAIPGTHYRANEQDLAGGCLPFLLDNILFHKNVLRNDGTPSASDALLDQKVSVGRANLAPHEPVLRNRFARGFSVTSLTTFRVTSSIVGASVKEASWDAYS